MATHNPNVSTSVLTGKMAAIGTVKMVIGTVTVTSPDGVVRVLQVGDKVNANDLIQTGDLASVDIEFVNGTHMDLGRNAQTVLDTDVFNPATVQPLAADMVSIQAAIAAGADPAAIAAATSAGASVVAMQAAIAAGADPTAIAAATAAGAGTASEGGHTFIQIDPNYAPGNVTSGFETDALTRTFLSPEGQTAGPLAPTVTVTGVDVVGLGGGTALEGNPITFQVSLSDPVGADTTVQVRVYTGTGDTATEGADYAAQIYTVIIPAGSTSVTFDVPTVGDNVVEGNETLSAEIVGATSAGGTINVDPGVAAGTIVDNDNAVISVSDETVIEGNTATFTVTLSNPSTQQVTVNFITANGTAISGGSGVGENDYGATSGTLTFAPGQTTATVQVSTNDDAVFEGSEQFTLNISNPVNATISDNQGVGTILDNEQQPTLSINNVTVNEDAGMAVFTVTLSGASATPVTVNYVTADGSATAGQDYSATSGSLTFAAGETSKTISVPITNDLVYEGSETFTVNLSGASAATISDNQGLGTILDNDLPPPPPPPPPVSISVAVQGGGLAEGNPGEPGGSTASFTVTLSAPSGTATTIYYHTTNGSATTGDSDYTGVVSGSIVIAAGATTGVISVPVTGDLTIEGDETFNVVLDGTSNSSITVDSTPATWTVFNDDSATATASVEMQGGGLAEGNPPTGSTADFTVTLSAPSSTATTIYYHTTNGSATTGDSDYTGVTSGSIVIAAGATTGVIHVPVTGDLTIEGNETFNVVLDSTSNANIGVNTTPATWTIINDDSATARVVAGADGKDGGKPEGNPPTGSTADFTVTLSAPSSTDTRIYYHTVNGTASTGDSDYTGVTSGWIDIAAGAMTGVIHVPVTGDLKVEPNENFTLVLDSTSNANIGVNTTPATWTIINDDSATATASVEMQGGGLAEGNPPTGSTADFTVTLSAPSSTATTIYYHTTNGSATTGDSDYTGVTSGSIVIAAGAITGVIHVPVTGDLTIEGDETFNVVLDSTSNAKIGVNTTPATWTIFNDDSATARVVAGADGKDGGKPEGNPPTGSTADFTVTLSAPSSTATTIYYHTVNGTATTDDNDYTAPVSGSIVIAAGAMTGVIHVPVTGDLTIEGNETFNVVLDSTSDANIGVNTTPAMWTIINDDSAPPPPPVPPPPMGHGPLGLINVDVGDEYAGSGKKILTDTYNGPKNVVSDSDHSHIPVADDSVYISNVSSSGVTVVRLDGDNTANSGDLHGWQQEHNNDNLTSIGTEVKDWGYVDLGGQGSDWVRVEQATPQSLTIDIREGGPFVSAENVQGGAGDDTIVGNGQANILQGGAGSDTIFGLGGDDKLEGGSGNDILVGGDGNDKLIGGVGNETLYGSAGSDTFVFRESGTANADTIMDFTVASSGGDVLNVADLLQGTGANGGNLSNFLFVSSSGGNTVVSVDLSGSGNIANATPVLTLQGVASTDLSTLLGNGQIDYINHIA